MDCAGRLLLRDVGKCREDAPPIVVMSSRVSRVVCWPHSVVMVSLPAEGSKAWLLRALKRRTARVAAITLERNMSKLLLDVGVKDHTLRKSRGK